MLGLKPMRGDAEYLDDVLNELEAMIADASSVPMRRGRAVLDRSDVLVLLDEVRKALPSELDDSERIREECREIVEESEKEARRIVERARSLADSRVESTELYRHSQRRAQEIVERAESRAEKVSRGSEDYREQVMDQLEGWVESSLYSIEESREELKNSQVRRASRRENRRSDNDQGWQASSA